VWEGPRLYVGVYVCVCVRVRTACVCVYAQKMYIYTAAKIIHVCISGEEHLYMCVYIYAYIYEMRRSLCKYVRMCVRER